MAIAYHTLTFSVPNADAADLLAGTEDGKVITPDVLGPVTAAGKALLSAANVAAQRAALDLEPGTDVQAYDADLTALAGLDKSDGNIIVGNGTTWVAENGDTARTSLGLGSAAVANLIDDGTMATASATNIPSAESTKAYADLKLAKASNLSDLADDATALENLGIEVRQGAYFGISSANSAAANDTAFASAMTWLNGGDQRALRLPTGVINVSATPLGITGNYKFVFGQHFGTVLRLASTATDGAFIRIGDGATLTNRIGIRGVSLWHQKTSGLSEPAVVINEASDIAFCDSWTTDIPGLMSATGNVSRTYWSNISGSYRGAHNVNFVKFAPDSGEEQSEHRFRGIICLDGNATGSTASVVKIAPINGGLFDSIWMDGFEAWPLGGSTYGYEIDVSGGSAVNMWFTDCCTDKMSTAGVYILNSGSSAYRARNIRFTNYRADCKNGAKNVVILNSNSNAGSCIQGIVFNSPMFPYQVDQTVDVQNTGSGIMDGIAFNSPVFHEFGSATKTTVMYFACNNWSVIGGHFDDTGSSGSTAFALKTSANATDFVFSGNNVKKPASLVDYSVWTSLDDRRVIDGNTGKAEPWAAGKTRVANMFVAASNSSTTQTDMITYNIPSMMLQQLGRRVRFTFAGVFAANGNTKTLRVIFGGSTVTVFSTTKSGTDFRGECVITLSTSGPVQRADYSTWFDDGTVISEGTSIAESTASAVTAKITTQGGASSDVITRQAEIHLI